MSIESKVTGLASKVHRRLCGRWRREPSAPAGTHNLVRKTAPTENLPHLPTSQWYRGYSDEDLSLFDEFPGDERSANGIHRRLPRCPDPCHPRNAFLKS